MDRARAPFVKRQPEEIADSPAVDPALAFEYSRETVVHRALGPASVATVLTLAMPTILESVIQFGIGLTDTIIAGHIPGSQDGRAAAGAAVGMMTYLQWFAGLMTSAFAVGATAIVARSVGARRPRVASRVAGTAMTGAFLISAGVSLLLFLFPRQVVALCNLHGLAAHYGEQYLRIMAITISLQTLGQVGLACLRGAGDTMRPMFITGGVLVVNAVTASTFCYGWFGAPAWGIRGNALGTMMAFLVGGVATMVMLLSGSARVRLRWRHFRLVGHVLMRILRIGLPSWAEGMLLWLGQFLIVILVITRTDKAIGVDGVTMAAHNAVLRVESLAFLPGFGFGIATSALVGQYLGARRPDEAKRAAKLSNRLAFCTMTLLAVPMVIFPGVLLKIIIGSDKVVATGLWPMVLAGLAQPGFAIAIIMGSALRGAGETVSPMLSTIVGMFAVRVPILLAALFFFHRYGHADWGLLAVWVGIFADLNFRGVLNSWWFLRGKWQTKRV